MELACRPISVKYSANRISSASSPSVSPRCQHSYPDISLGGISGVVFRKIINVDVIGETGNRVLPNSY